MVDQDTPAHAPKRNAQSRVATYAVIAALVTGLIAAAYYQEQISAFFKLRLWDRDAAAKVVTAFLDAGRSGDKAAADSLMGTKSYQPLTENGKWVGYYIVSQGGRMDIPFSDLLPAGDPTPNRTEFVTVGAGAAEVFVPNSSDQAIKYRLEMQQDGWKITEILGGHPAQPAPASGARGGGPPSGGGARSGGGPPSGGGRR
jgi:hypothetical protein